MSKVKLSDAPGCIGSPIIRKEGHPICENCNFKNICAKLSHLNAKRLMDDLGLSALSSETGRKLIPGSEKLTIAQLESPAYKDKKPLTERGRITQRGIFDKSGGTMGVLEVMQRTSRIAVKHGLQNVQPDWAQHLLLLIWDNNGSVTKKDLRDYLHHELGQSRTVSTGNVSNFTNATTNADLLKEDRETLRLLND